MRNNDKAVVIWVCIILLFALIAAGFTIGINYAGKASTFLAFQLIVLVSYALVAILTVIPLYKYFNPISVLLMALNIVLSFGKIYFLEYRTYHKLLIVLLALSVINLAGYPIYFFRIGRRKKGLDNIYLVNGIIPIAYVFMSVFINMFRLFKLIDTEIDVFGIWAGIALIISVLVAIVVSFFVKSGGDKKEKIGKILAIFFGVFILAYGIPFVSLEHTNYAFDSSDGARIEFLVADKYTTSRYKSGTSYYLVLREDGEEFSIAVDKMTYVQHEQGGTLYMYYHDGAFGYPYYEYRQETVYGYRVE
jgi:hypothetical protein